MGFNHFLKRTITKSQQCNRNWDLSDQIRDADLETMKTAVAQCSSKQNRVFYKVLVTQDRDKIEKIHLATKGFTAYAKEGQPTVTNSQVLANTLFIFVKDRDESVRPRTANEVALGVTEGKTSTDEDRAIGIAAGYLTLTANLLDYETGCCQCFNKDALKDILGIDDEVFLLMGVGIGDKTRNRREHHNDPGFVFPSFKKNIKVEVI
jgi:nitroreductase